MCQRRLQLRPARRLVDFLNHAESAAETAGSTVEPTLASIDGTAERVDASGELEALFILKPREE